MEKRCSKCGKVKDIKEFWKGTKKYGRDHYCILCRKEYKKEHKYSEYQRKYKKEWSKKNKERILSYREKTYKRSVEQLLPSYLRKQVSITENIRMKDVTEEQMKVKKKSILLYREQKKLKKLRSLKKKEQLIEVEGEKLKPYVPDKISCPCLNCEFRDKDKNREECKNCNLRIEYIEYVRNL